MPSSRDVNEFKALQPTDAEEFIACVIVAETQVPKLVASSRVDSTFSSKDKWVLCTSSRLNGCLVEVLQMLKSRHLIDALYSELPLRVISSREHLPLITDGKSMSLPARDLGNLALKLHKYRSECILARTEASSPELSIAPHVEVSITHDYSGLITSASHLHDA